jgi:hypothetical protein
MSPLRWNGSLWLVALNFRCSCALAASIIAFQVLAEIPIRSPAWTLWNLSPTGQIPRLERLP